MAEPVDEGRPRRRWTLALVAFIIGVSAGLLLPRFDWGWLTPSYTLKTYLSNSGGLRVSSDVRVAGVPVGSVRSIRVSPSGSLPVEISMRIARKYQPSIRVDSQARLAVDGLFGKEYLEISRGTPTQPVLPPGGIVKTQPTFSLFDPAACDQLTKTFLRLAGALKAITGE